MSDVKTENLWLMHGNCLDRMKEIPDSSISMILADPPYQMTQNSWDCLIDVEQMWAELKRVIKPSGAILLFGSQPFTTKLAASNMSWLRYMWYWRKSRPAGHMNAKKAPLRDVEDIVVFYSKQPTYNPQGIVECSVVKKNTKARSANGSNYGAVAVDGKDHVQKATNYPRQVLDFASPHNVGALHPTQKPVALLEYLIKTYTNEGETVLDFTQGSGSAGVAAVNTGRKYFGVEMDDHYFNISKERILATTQAP